MIDAKCYVIAFALTAFALIITYDLTFGMAAGVLLAVIGGIWLYLSIWLAPERGQPDSERGALVDRFRRLQRNRSEARLREIDSENGPGKE